MQRQQIVRHISPKSYAHPALLVVTALTMLLVMTFGGGPNVPGWRYLVVMIPSLALLAVALYHGAWSNFNRLGLLSKSLLTLIVLFPVIQLIPIPPYMWQALPGRDLEHQIFDLVGASQQWHPITTDPARTFFLLTTFAVPAAIFFAVQILDRRELRALSFIVAGFALVSIFVGLLQFSSGGNALNFYDSSHKRFLLGFFANRNHQGLFIAIGLVLAVSLVFRRNANKRFAISLSALLVFFCLAAAAATASRAGLLLTAFAALSIFLVKLGLGKRPWVTVSALVGSAVLIFVLFQSTSTVFEDVYQRYAQADVDGRWQFWENSLALGNQYFPFGTGLGSFVASYQAFEPLEQISSSYLNHVHNDYLELYLEAGIGGMILVFLFVLTVGRSALSQFRAQGNFDSWAVPVIIIVLILGHSVVDYPMRTAAIAMIFGFALGLLFRLQKD